MPEVSVSVRRGGRIVDQVTRPIRQVAGGLAVTYRRRLWPLSNDSIDLDAPPISTEVKEEVSANGNTPLTKQDHSSIAPELSDEFIDEGQGLLLALPGSARVLVDAPPGTGKTHVACQRVASLIQGGANPSRIWIISFTRTAVFEIRNRIAAALETGDAASVRIATLDSHAWSLQSGFSPNAKLTGGHESGIEQTLMLLRSDPETIEYLARLDHVVIDEGQDIVGSRAALTLAIVDAVTGECGVTVFADEAQAIYAFSEDESAGTAESSLLDQLQERSFSALNLTHVYRTQNPRLRSVFVETRKHVLDKSLPIPERAARVRGDIIRLANADAGPIGALRLKAIPADSLVLLRRRADVLEQSAWNPDIPHRLRMSGLPPRIRPWLGAMFWDFCERTIAYDQFAARWRQRVTGIVAEGAPAVETAWNLLVEFAGKSATAIEMGRVREVLGRLSPPVLFCSPDFGDSGPILGTIHASKGREAACVYLYLPPESQPQNESEEEIRVMFVGATRARDILCVGQSGAQYAGRLSSQRVWRKVKNGRARLEIGRPRDLDSAGLVGRSAFNNQGDALKAQVSWLETPVCKELRAAKEKQQNWQYVLLNADNQRLAVFNHTFDEDLREVAQSFNTWRTPAVLPHLRSLGLRSMVLRSGDPALEDLYEPWRSSGFFFAPLLTGFTTGKFG